MKEFSLDLPLPAAYGEGNVYVATMGGLTRLTGDGQTRWSKDIPFSTAFAGFEADDQGWAYVSGPFGPELDLGRTTLTSNGDYDIYIAAYTAAGDLRWARSIGGPWADMPSALAIGGDQLAIAGYRVSDDSYSDSAVYLASWTESGALRWEYTFGSGDGVNAGAQAVATNVAGDVALSGNYEDQLALGSTTLSGGAYFLARFDDGGALQWATDAPEPVEALAMDSSGNIYTLTVSGDAAFITRYDPEGTADWSWTTIAAGLARKLRIAADDTIWVTGCAGTLDEGDGTLATSDVGAPFVASLDPDGTYRGGRLLEAASSELGPISCPALPEALSVGADGQAVIAGRLLGGLTVGSQSIQSTEVESTFFLASVLTDLE